MKRLLQLLLCGSVALSLGACSNRVEEAAPDASTPVAAADAPTVSVTPREAHTIPGRSVDFQATVSGLESQDVLWTLREGVESGSISAAGVYTASQALGTFHVVATSAEDSSVRGEATVTVSVPDEAPDAGTQPDAGIDPCVPGTAGDLLIDGEFDHGLQCWQANRANAPEGGFRLDNADHPAGTSAPSVRVDNDQVGNNLWDTQLFQNGLTLNSGEVYDLSFWIKASENRDVVVIVQQVDPGPTTHFHYEVLPVTTQWQKIVRRVTATSNMTNGMVEFQFGSSSVAPVWVDGVKLERVIL